MAYYDRPKETLVPVPYPARARIGNALRRCAGLFCVAVVSGVATASTLIGLRLC
ncbi:MAG TPA: hypothetical protein VFB35_00235 [Gaiellaceae bacterium]|nr:hypothetical protein [Gaiellaceae bacterium]